jgi:hypothetical protein
MKLLVFFLLQSFICIGQWMNAPADCPIAYRICDVTQSYKFALIDAGTIDDAHGALEIPGLNRSSPNQFESRTAFIVFTPQYSGQFGLMVCPETIEDLNFILFENPNCNDLETGNYSISTQQDTISSNNYVTACTGIGINPFTAPNLGDWNNYIAVTAGNTYKLYVSVNSINQSGTHRFTLSFQGSVVTAHPDLFNYPGCVMARQEFTQNTISVYPNPFTNVLQIKSDTVFKTMALYDVLGKQIIHQPFVNELNTSALSQGVYFLHLIDSEGDKVVKKVVRE